MTTSAIHGDDAVRFDVLQQSLQHFPHPVLVISDSHGVDFVNQAFCDYHGLEHEPSELCGKSATEVLALIRPRWFDQAIDDQRITEVLRRGKAKRGVEFTLHDGRAMLLDWIPIDVEGRHNCCVWHTHDITERRLLEAVLRQREDDMRFMLNGIPAIVLLTEGEGQRAVMLNERFAEICGYARSEVVDIDTWWRLAYPDPEYRAWVIATWTERVDRAIANRSRVEPLETRVTCADGQVKDIEWGFVSSGERHVVYGLDISARKQAERERADLEARNYQLEKERSLDRMAGAVAHHINNQLHVVMMSLQLVVDGMPHAIDAPRLPRGALEATINTVDVGNKLLTSLGATRASMKPLDLAEACHRLMPVLRAAAPAPELVNPSIPLYTPPVLASEQQFHQLVLALMANACEAVTGTDQAVYIDLDVVRAEDIPSKHRFPRDYVPRDGRYVCLRITDTGVGIAADDVDRLFDPFFSSKLVGRGLGLPMSLGIARAHDAAMTVSSTPGLGSTFGVYFPEYVLPLPT